ncbi:MAG: serine hydroxymethyltransferase, partial [Bacteroidales bacterium]|nr:serine hydroxymethyltransferase [Bacteroidales bacterium]
GIRLGTAAITTRGVKENEMEAIAEMIDSILSDVNNEENILKVRKQVNEMMSNRPLFAW